jgi:hypothetical protein
METMIMHSIAEPRPEIPKRVLQAEKMLKLLYPGLYAQIAGYRNCQHMDELRYEQLKIVCERYGNIQHITPYLFAFCGFPKSGPEEAPAPKEKLMHRIKFEDSNIRDARRSHRSGRS